MDRFQPLLAAKCENIDTLRYPLFASPKLDGIRCIVINGEVLTRKLKPVPNHHVRHTLLSCLPRQMDFDGELGLFNPIAPFEEVSSAIMSHEGHPRFKYRVFDVINSSDYASRYDKVIQATDQMTVGDYVDPVAQHVVNTPGELQGYINSCAAAGYEGVMVRSMNGRYKCGRSTVREGILLKIKSFDDEEAIVIGYVEQMANNNEAVIDERGYTKRSSVAANKVGKRILGALKCRFEDGAEFDVGTGFNNAQRVDLWLHRDTLLGEVVRIKHQPPPGGRKSGQAPRFPVWLGIRHKDDM